MIFSQLTTEQQIVKTVTEINEHGFRAYDSLLLSHRQLWDKIWNNEKGLTPHQILAGIGVSALALFTYSNVVIQAINTIEPNSYNPTVPYEYTINADGSITLGALIETEEANG